jgi:hypothetical protein
VISTLSDEVLTTQTKCPTRPIFLGHQASLWRTLWMLISVWRWFFLLFSSWMETEESELEKSVSLIEKHLQQLDFLTKNDFNQHAFLLLHRLLPILSKEDNHLEDYQQPCQLHNQMLLLFCN